MKATDFESDHPGIRLVEGGEDVVRVGADVCWEYFFEIIHTNATNLMTWFNEVIILGEDIVRGGADVYWVYCFEIIHKIWWLDLMKVLY